MIGAFSLGNAFPNISTFAAGQGAAYTVWEIIDRVSAEDIVVLVQEHFVHACIFLLFAFQEPPIDSSSDEGICPATCQGNVGFNNIHFIYPSRPEVKV